MPTQNTYMRRSSRLFGIRHRYGFDQFERRILLSTSGSEDGDDTLFSAGDTTTNTASAGESATVELLDPIQMYGHTGYKPPSKVWTHDNQVWTVFADLSGTGIW